MIQFWLKQIKTNKKIFIFQKVTGITLEEFAKKPSPFIDKGDLISKSLQPKHYRLIIHPIFEDQHHPFTFNGTVWIVLTAKKGNNLRKIELNVKELQINDEDVDVYRSYRTPTLDYKNLLDWDDDEDEIIIQRRKRQEENFNATTDEVLNETTISSIEDETTTKSSESSTVSSNKNDENEDENTAAVELNRIGNGQTFYFWYFLLYKIVYIEKLQTVTKKMKK